MKPIFIAIEGGEGAGKSKLIEAAQERFGNRLLYTREPGGSEYAEAHRDLIFNHRLSKEALGETTLCNMFGGRYDTIVKRVIPALKKGQSVISDRVDGSSYAYNVWAQSGGRLEPLFLEMRKVMTITPHHYIFLDVDPVEGRRRAQSRNSASAEAAAKGNHFDDQKIEFYRKVREGYMKFFSLKDAQGKPLMSYTIIDANRPLTEVKEEFLDVVEKLIGL